MNDSTVLLWLTSALIGAIVGGVCIAAMLFGDQLVKKVRPVLRWLSFFLLVLFNASFAAFMCITLFELMALKANGWFQLFGFICGYFVATRAIPPIRRMQEEFVREFNQCE